MRISSWQYVLILHQFWKSIFYLVRFPDWLESQSGERTPQELGISLWSHITQHFQWWSSKVWCLLENCIRGQATDIGVTHFPSLVAQQEAVLGRLAFATWWGQSLYCRICSFSSLVFVSRNNFAFLASNISIFLHYLRWKLSKLCKFCQKMSVKTKKITNVKVLGRLAFASSWGHICVQCILGPRPSRWWVSSQGETGSRTGELCRPGMSYIVLLFNNHLVNNASPTIGPGFKWSLQMYLRFAGASKSALLIAF